MGCYDRLRTVFCATLCLTVIAGPFSTGCTSRHQVVKYEDKIQKSENVIPGIEAAEAEEKIRITVTGTGLEPENGTPQYKKLMAERAAIMDGYRKLSERLAGAIIKVYSESGNNSISKDRITSETNAYLRGAQVASVAHENGMALAQINLFIQPREIRFYHGTKTSRTIIGALTGLAIGAAAGGAAGLLTDSTDEVIYTTMGVAGAAGAAIGGAAGSQ